MTTQRQAQDLCGRDRGRTIATYDQATGDSITGPILGIDHTTNATHVWVAGRFSSMRLLPEQLVNISGQRTPAEPRVADPDDTEQIRAGGHA